MAKALIAANLRELAARDLAEAALLVDAAGEHGALGLYKRMGFELESREFIFERSANDPQPPVDASQ